MWRRRDSSEVFFQAMTELSRDHSACCPPNLCRSSTSTRMYVSKGTFREGPNHSAIVAIEVCVKCQVDLVDLAQGKFACGSPTPYKNTGAKSPSDVLQGPLTTLMVGSSAVTVFARLAACVLHVSNSPNQLRTPVLSHMQHVRSDQTHNTCNPGV